MTGRSVRLYQLYNRSKLRTWYLPFTSNGIPMVLFDLNFKVLRMRATCPLVATQRAFTHAVRMTSVSLQSISRGQVFEGSARLRPCSSGTRNEQKPRILLTTARATVGQWDPFGRDRSLYSILYRPLLFETHRHLAKQWSSGRQNNHMLLIVITSGCEVLEPAMSTVPINSSQAMIWPAALQIPVKRWAKQAFESPIKADLDFWYISRVMRSPFTIS